MIPSQDPRKVNLPLPDQVPLFPLREAILLPRGRLPLNVFEPRYLEMLEYALAHQRIIGMIRPRHDDDVHPPLYDVGCAGRITSFAETEDGRMVLTLGGVSRFRLLRDELHDGGFRLGRVDFAPYVRDLVPPEVDHEQIRMRLVDILGQYLEALDLSADWGSVEGAPVEAIVNGISMACPFDPDEQQALLEAGTVARRAEALMAMMELAIATAAADTGAPTTDRLQ